MPPRRLPVATVITRLDVGGAQETAVGVAASVDPDRFDVVLLAGAERRNAGYEDRLRAAGVPLVTVADLRGSLRPVSDVRALVRLVRVLRERRPDVVHTHSSKAGVLGRVAARLAGVPVTVHTVHGWSFSAGMPGPARWVAVALERLLARRTTALVVVGESDRAAGLARGIGVPSSYHVIRSGVDVDRFRLTPGRRAAIRTALGVPEGVPLVGTVGRLAAQKDPEAFVAMAHGVHRARPDARFVVVGDGPLRTAIEQAIAQQGLDGVVTLLGERDDVEQLLAALDVFVLTSRWEGLPRAVVEAMAAGVPVVASAVGCVADVVRHERTGLLVPAGDGPGFSAAVTRLLDDPTLRARLAAAAQPMVDEFSATAMVAGHEALYEQLARAGVDCSPAPPFS